MKILLLGYGKEGQAIENYFKTHTPDAQIEIWQDFTPTELKSRDYSPYDIIFRSPSVPPLGLPQESSVTKYFFDHCPCPIIGVTATKGKGTTCSFIKSLLDAHGYDAYLVGNIGEPAINVLDRLTVDSVVVYEMSSFQLWDLQKSPHISVVGMIEPDHLNVHTDFQDYVNAKSNIVKWQTENDYCVFFSMNPDSVKISRAGHAHRLPYPFKLPDEIKNAINLPGLHNLNNALAAIAAVACLQNISPDEYLREQKSMIIEGLKNFRGLPHRLEFLREVNGVKYYDDNFSTNVGSTRVAVNAFPDERLVMIVGGRDKTDYEDLEELHEILELPQVLEIILIGESGQEYYHRYHDYNRLNMFLEYTLEDAVRRAQGLAESYTNYSKLPIVIMSPAAASFDMFKNVYDRGEQYQKLVKSLKDLKL